MTALSARFQRFMRRIEAPPQTPLKDWPAELRMNAASARLAPVLYAAHCDVWRGCEPTPWIQLHHAIRHAWVQRAERAIRSVR